MSSHRISSRPAPQALRALAAGLLALATVGVPSASAIPVVLIEDITISSRAVSPSLVTAAGTAITAIATAAQNADSTVALAEVRVGAAPWTAMAPVDGAWGATVHGSEATTAPLLRGATALAAGVGHVCAVLADTRVACWGNNGEGALGDGTTTNRISPVVVPGLTGVTAVVAGGYHTCALLAAGTARCWGYNAYGQLGDGTSTDRISPVAVAGIAGAIALTAGVHHTCALLADGTARCWGYNGYGQLGDGTTASRALPAPVGGLAGVTAVAAGGLHTCAVLADGMARCWGNNAVGQLGDGTTTNRSAPVTVPGLVGVAAIATGGYHTCALIADGTVRCWGNDGEGQLGDGTSTSTPRTAPVTVSGLVGATGITAGSHHTCALLVAGTARCWGYNAYGQLGDGSTTMRTSPAAVVGVATGTAIEAGEYQSCALTAAGTAHCWGFNSAGQLGDGTTSWTRLTPVGVAGIGAMGLSDVADGVHQVCFRATNAVGTTSTESICSPLTVDTTAPVPTTPVLSPSRVPDTTTAVAIGSSVGDVVSVASAQYRVDGGSWTSMDSFDGEWGEAAEGATSLLPAATVAALAEGPHQVCVRAADNAGHTSAGTSCATLVMDAAAPTATTPRVTPSLVSSTAAPVVIAGKVTDAGGVASAVYRVNGGQWTALSALDGAWGGATESVFGSLSAAAVAALGDGAHQVCVRGLDLSGHEGDGTACVTLTIDLAAPGVASFTSTSATPTGAATIEYTLVFTEPVTGLEAGDLTNAGTATECTLTPSAASGATVTVSVSCSGGGTVTPVLAAGAVADGNSHAGPAADATAASTIVFDPAAPSFGTALTVAPKAGAVLPTASGTSGIPVVLGWAATDDSGAIDHYVLETSVNGGSTWTTVALASATALSATVNAPSTGAWQARVTAYDAVGNHSTSAVTLAAPRLVQQAGAGVTTTGTWTAVTGATLSAGSAKWAKAAGASATYSFTGPAVIGIVATRSAASGSFKVLVDGVLKATVSLTAATTKTRVIAWQGSVVGAGAHTVKLVLVGTAGHPRVDLDAFAVLR